MRNIDSLFEARQRQFRRFRAFIISVQVLMVVGAVYLFTHPETIGGFLGRIVAGFESSHD